MSDVKSKNLYELLGNDHDEDSDRELEPAKVAENPTERKGKREAPIIEVPTGPRGGTSDRGSRRGRGGRGSSDRAFNDREAGSVNNRNRPIDDGVRQDRHSNQIGGGRIQNTHDGRGGRGGRGSRGGRGGRDDRHSRGPQNDHVKQADQSWGAPTGEAEWNDEKAGEAIAETDTSGVGFDPNVAYDPNFDNPANAALPAEEPIAAPAPEPEPEDKSRSYEDYLAEQMEKKANLSGNELSMRKPNEGSKGDSKWKDAKPLDRGEEEKDYFAGSGGKAKRERAKKEKNVLDVDIKYVEPNTGRGGGERGRGGRGRGEGRGDFRSRGGRGRGDGFRGRGDRGDGGYRGGRGGGRGGGGQINANDENAFPTLGGGSGGGKDEKW